MLTFTSMTSMCCSKHLSQKRIFRNFDNFAMMINDKVSVVCQLYHKKQNYVIFLVNYMQCFLLKSNSDVWNGILGPERDMKSTK